MKALVVYYSETGNTEKVARAICEELSREHEAHLKAINEVNTDHLNNYDLVFLGSACHNADLATPIRRLLNAIHACMQEKSARRNARRNSDTLFLGIALACSLRDLESS